MSKENLAPVWARAFDIDVDYAEGIYIHDTQGQRYMDFTSGIGVTNTGHAHPRVVKAIQDQAARMTRHRPVSSAGVSAAAPTDAPFIVARGE